VNRTVAAIFISLGGCLCGSVVGFILAWWIYADDLPEGDYPSIFPDQTADGVLIGGLVGLVVPPLFYLFITPPDDEVPGREPAPHQAHQPRTPASTLDAQSLVWAIVFAAFIFFGMVATEFSTVAALVVAAIAGLVVFLFVRMRGDDHVDR
jgi:MFS family permease